MNEKSLLELCTKILDIVLDEIESTNNNIPQQACAIFAIAEELRPLLGENK